MKVISASRQIGLKRGWAFSFAATTTLVLLASLPPFVGESTRAFIMELFSSVCHQIPSRSPHVDGISLAVCHRCYGTYLGFPAAALLFGAVKGQWPFTPKTAPLFLALAVMPAFLDWGGGIVGVWTNTPSTRVVTGLIMGTAAGYFLTAAITDSFIGKENRKRAREESRI
jgi:uncharacterized membrane protein